MSIDDGLGTSCSSQDCGLSYKLLFSIFFLFFIAASHNLELSVAQEIQGRRGRIWSEQGGNMAITSDTLLLSPVHLSAPLGLQ